MVISFIFILFSILIFIRKFLSILGKLLEYIEKKGNMNTSMRIMEESQLFSMFFYKFGFSIYITTI